MPDFDRLKKKCSPSLFFLAISLFFLLLLLIRQPVFSLARYFQNAGYQTAGLHLMDRSNYNRNTIYPLLGLSSFWALEDYDSVDALRGYATDRDDYQKLIALEESMATRPASSSTSPFRTTAAILPRAILPSRWTSPTTETIRRLSCTYPS